MCYLHIQDGLFLLELKRTIEKKNIDKATNEDRIIVKKMDREISI